MLFFFFKQKAAYEMLISDWSSDVCSSDLLGKHPVVVGDPRSAQRAAAALCRPEDGHAGRNPAHRSFPRHCDRRVPLGGHRRALLLRLHESPRSEEHTSELQSLMRISYAVFCLKKKNITTIKNTYKDKRK